MLFVAVKWTPTARKWRHAALFVRAVRYEDAGVIVELNKARLPEVAWRGTSIWRDTEGKLWRAHRTQDASDVLAIGLVRIDDEDSQ